MNRDLPFSWRKVRPVIQQEKCTYCGECIRVCQFGAVYQDEGEYRVSYDLCRGCGICALDCLRRAITMRLP